MKIYTEQMDAKGLGRKLLLTSRQPPETTEKNANPGSSLSLSFCSGGMLFRGFLGVTGRGQQQFATQTLRVHLLGTEKRAVRWGVRSPSRTTGSPYWGSVPLTGSLNSLIVG